MNDLSGLDWSSKQSSNQRPSNYSAFSTLKPTPPGSGRVSPQPPSKPVTPANDSFSNLVSFSSTNANNKNLSLQDQQKRLSDLKSQQAGNTKTNLNQYSRVDDSVWNNLGSGRSTPAPPTNGSKNPQPAKNEEEDDMFAVFNAPKATPASNTSKTPQVLTSGPEDDDDPFGLSEFQAKAKQSEARFPQNHGQEQISTDDDDVLGLLGRPVSEFPPPKQNIADPEPEPQNAHPQDKAVAELVDMGFPVEKARRALESTETGLDVQAAVGILLNQAHSEAQERSRNTSANREGTDSRSSRSRPPHDEPVMPPRRDKASTPSNEAAQMASELSASFLKTAGSLWKQGQKRFQQAVQDFNTEGESNQPKWMRDASPAARPNSRPARREEGFVDESSQRPSSSKQKQDDSVTDEALMLESQRPDKPARPSQRQRPRQEPAFDTSRDVSRDHSPAMPSRLREASSSQLQQTQAPRPRQQQAPPSRTSLNRQAAEEQAAQAYVSSARRRKPAAVPTEPELLEQSMNSPAASRTESRPTSIPQSKPPPRPVKSTPIQVRPSAPPRNIPSVSAISLKASHFDREAGNEHFKRGDYSSAHQSYSKSLSRLPVSHPVTIILLTNRALTAIKIGEPKIAVTDSDAAIALIGPAKGESETVDLTNGDTPKPMRDYYGKALMRKAEALEHMEKWAEAAVVWRETVESGHGGATAIQARQRAENAAKPKPVASAKPAPTKPAGKSAAVKRAGAIAEKAAIDKLRAQNAAAEKVDDERFQLSEAVDTRVNNWRGGKQENLRALLGSLELVLWPEAGWKKISMADLVLPNKVKIQYMKGIAKVHPDKIPTDATTEQRMIAGAVFSTLNEAWDKFKKDNNL